MAICLIKKGGGGIQSEDVTALRSEVLKGKTALTIDSNDEVIEGTMELLTANSDLVHVMMCFDRGAGDHWGMGGAIDSPSHGRGIIISMRPEDFRKYALDDRSVFVFMPVPDLRPENIRSDKNIAKIQGGIPIWSVIGSGWGDILYAWADEGHAWDHPVAGRGVLSKIPNGHIIEGANWVFLKAPTLLPWNIRKGVNVLGVQGEMVDYGTGRAAFYNATFDGNLLSGVASADREIFMGEVYAVGNMSFSSRYFISISNPDKHKFLVILDGGLRFSLKAQGDTKYSEVPVAAFFDHSINLTPFRKIRIGGKFLSGSYRKQTNKNDLSNATFGIVAISKKNVTKNVTAQRYAYSIDLNNNYKGVHVSFQDGAQDDKEYEGGRLTGQQLWAEIDVLGINEQCYMFAYAQATSFYPMSAEVVINHIEFIN